MAFSQRGRISPAILPLVAAVLLFTALAFLLTACGGNSSGVSSTLSTAVSTGGASGSTIQVAMVNRTFDPATITIKVGDTVTWTNQDPVQHDVVAEGGEFKSQLFSQGETFSFTFAKAGTYPYYCSIHPGMKGTVVVQ